ncbi:MAG: phytanoyl-CoA dioxygenase family protein [Chitinophagales bacterium]
MQSVLLPQYHDIQQELSQNGFVKISFLDAEQLSSLRTHYNEYLEMDTPFINGIHMSTWMSDIKKKLLLRDSIEKILKKSFDQYFTDYKVSNTTFIVKKKHKVSNFPLHQDWSFVDEEKFEALNVWIPLQDTTIYNGGLYVIPGSHKLSNKVRGAGMLSVDYTPYHKQLKPYLTPVSLKAGEALLFYYAVIHGSPDNKQASDRVIVSTSVMPLQAPMIVNYYNQQQHTTEQYAMPDDFVYLYDDIKTQSTTQPPKGMLINSFPYKKYEVSVKEIAGLIPPSFKNPVRLFFNTLKAQLS